MNELLKDKLWREFNDIVDVGSSVEVLVVAVRLPTGAIEIITNTEGIPEKVRYYMDKYDENFHLIANPFVQVVGYMLV